MPITRSTSGARSSAPMKGLPISPVGPVTATVSIALILPLRLRRQALGEDAELPGRRRPVLVAGFVDGADLENMLARLQLLVFLR